MSAMIALAVNCESTGKPGVCDTHADVPPGGMNPVAALVKASAGKAKKPKKLNKKEQVAKDEADKVAKAEADRIAARDASDAKYQAEIDAGHGVTMDAAGQDWWDRKMQPKFDAQRKAWIEGGFTEDFGSRKTKPQRR